MECKFYYDGDALSSTTMLGLVQQLLADTNTNPDNYLIDSLNFFNADGSEISGAIETIRKEGKKKTAKKVTEFIKDTLRILGKKETESVLADSKNAQIKENEDVFQDYVENYLQKFGIQYHKCAEILSKQGRESEEYKKAIDKLWDIIVIGQTNVEKWRRLAGDNAPMKASLSFLTNIKSKQEFELNIVPKSLEDLFTALKRNGQTNHILELRIDDQLALGGKDSIAEEKGVTGIIDAVTWDGDGNVTIWDFKTTPNEVISYNTKLYRYLQLRLYKELFIRKLDSMGIKVSYDKVKIKTLLIRTTINNGDLPFLEVKEIDPEKEFQNTKKEYLEQAGKLIDILYPMEGKTLSPSETRLKLQDIEGKVAPIISKLGISIMTKENQMERIEKAIKLKKPLYLQHIPTGKWKTGASIASWSTNGDKVIGYGADKEVLVNDTLENIAQTEADFLKQSLNLKTRALAEAINAKSYDLVRSQFRFDLDAQRALLLAVEPLLSDEYQYVKIALLEENYNIVTFKNRADNTYTFLVLSDLVGLRSSRKDAKNILEPVFKDQSVLKRFKEAKELPAPNAENILTLLAMIAINECKELIDPNNQLKIDKIQVVSMANGTQSSGLNLGQFTNALKLLEYQATTQPDSLVSTTEYKDIHTKWQKNISISSTKDVLTKTVLNRIFLYNLNNPDSLLDSFSSLNVEETSRRINALIQEIENSIAPSVYLNMGEEIGRIYNGLTQLKLMYQSGDVLKEINKRTEYGLTASEVIGAGIDILMYGEAKRYTFNGMVLNGIALGLNTSTSYSNPDTAVAFYERMFREAAGQVSYALNDLALPFNLATKKFLRDAGKSQISVAVIGNTTDAYELLFEHDGDKIAPNMQLKNPYSAFSELVSYQQEYIKEVLWIFNKFRIKGELEGFDEKYKKMSYAEFEKTSMHDDYVTLINNNPELREVPLKLKNSTEGVISNIRDLFDPEDSDEEVRGRIKKFCSSIKNRWDQAIAPVLLTPEQKTGMDSDIDESKRYFEYHSPYNKQGENRVQMLNNNSLNSWEKNLNILALEYACSQLQEIYFLQVLQTVGNLLGQIDLAEVMTGEDLSKTKDALINRLKISVYSRNLVDTELSFLSTVASGLKRGVSFAKLAMRPGTFAKEMVLGIIRNFSTIFFENFVNDVPITIDHLMRAASVVYTNGLFVNEGFAPDDETFGDFRLVGAINNLYRINDRDLNLLGESIAYDSHGIMHWGSRMLYLNTTSPDWFNRMTILVAKMMADGTWEAHSLTTDGRLVYDPFKDKRFKRFLSFYRQHPNLENEPKDEEYVLSKARYALTIQLLKKEGFTDLVGSDGEGYSIIPVCYTQQEMSSVKEQIGTLYGFYSHEERATIQKTIWWLLHTQFLTYLPSEIRKYCANGDIESAVGKVVHQTDPFTGKKLYYTTNEAGLTEVVNEDELTYDQKTNPVLEFTYSPMEGLLISTLKTFSLVWHGERKEIPKDQLNRTRLFFFNLLIAAIIGALLGALGVYVHNKRATSKEEKRQADLLAAGVKVLRSASLELLFFTVYESALASMGIVGYDGMKLIMSSVMSKLVSNPGDFFPIINQLGFINDFQIH